jgi:hypothetical protein
MKTIKALLLMSLITMSFSFGLNGCYTQLAFVNNDQDSAVEPSQTIIYQHEIVSVYVPMPAYNPQSSPVMNSLPTAGSSSTTTQSQSQPQTRESGYQRSDQSGITQTTSSISNTRTSGSTRGGR